MQLFINISKLKLIFWLLLIPILLLQSKADNLPLNKPLESNLSKENHSNQTQDVNNKIWNKTEVELLKRLADRRNLIEQQEKKTIQDKQKILVIIEKILKIK